MLKVHVPQSRCEVCLRPDSPDSPVATASVIVSSSEYSPEREGQANSENPLSSPNKTLSFVKRFTRLFCSSHREASINCPDTPSRTSVLKYDLYVGDNTPVH